MRQHLAWGRGGEGGGVGQQIEDGIIRQQFVLPRTDLESSKCSGSEESTMYTSPWHSA